MSIFGIMDHHASVSSGDSLARPLRAGRKSLRKRHIFVDFNGVDIFPKMTHLHRSRSQKTPPDPDTEAISQSIIVNGVTEHILSYRGTSQYSEDGTGASACGLAALNFARIVFSMEKAGLQDTALLRAVLARECAEETTAICALWSGNLHLDVEDICRIPLFEKTLELQTTTYGLPGVSKFKSLLRELSNLGSSAVAIITRPPEIIACLKLRLTKQNVFIIFDSHPRPSYPNGAGMIVSTSIEGTARRLAELLPAVDLPDGFLQWQAQLLANYSGHVFVPHGVETSTPSLWQAVLESSLTQLSMQAEISELRSQNELLKSEQQRLESEIKEVKAGSQRQERLIQQQQKQQKQKQQQLGSRSRPLKYFDQPSSSPLSPPKRFTSSTRHSEPSRPSSPEASTSTPTFNPFGPDSPTAGSSSGRELGHLSGIPTPPSDRDDRVESLLYAMRLQYEFDSEDRALAAQREDLAKFTQRLFVCGICLEEMPDDSIARPDSCGHTFCRECLRGHVAARINEHRFPVLCPTCTANKGKRKGAAGEVSQALALDLGLTDEQYSIWTEMELVSLSVRLHCRKCQRTMFVSRDELDEVNIITCPLPDCNHAWCKECQQSLDSKDSEHSCDGTLELDHLMKEQGWKYCPACKTPSEKISGCNHLMCMTPGCNTHFCYQCGRLMRGFMTGVAQTTDCRC